MQNILKKIPKPDYRPGEFIMKKINKPITYFFKNLVN